MAEITQDSNMLMFWKGTIFVGMLVHVLKIGATKTWTVSSGYDIQITTKEFISWHGRATTLTGFAPCVTIVPCEIIRCDLSLFVLHFGTAAPLCYELQSVGHLFAQPSSSRYRSVNVAPFSAWRYSVGREMQRYQPHLQSVTPIVSAPHIRTKQQPNTHKFHTEPTGHKTYKTTWDIIDTSWVSILP